MIMHKHNGVERETGALRAHPMTRQHKDSWVQANHNKALNTKQKKYKQGRAKKKAVKKVATKKITKKKTVTKKATITPKTLLVSVDSQGYININLDKSKTKGLRVSFTRSEGRTKKTVGLQIENDPDTRSGKGRLVTNRSY